METAETLTEQFLTNNIFDPTALWWWGAVFASLLAGFMVPLPYAYYQLRKYGKSCCHASKNPLIQTK